MHVPRPARWLLAALVLATLVERRRETPPEWLLDEAARGALQLDPGRMGYRDLRRLPGVGGTRAALLLEALRAGHLERWSDVRGIGPKTEQRVEAWIRARRGSGNELLEQ